MDMRFLVFLFISQLFAFSKGSFPTSPTETSITYYTEGECGSNPQGTCSAYLGAGNQQCNGTKPAFCCEEFIPRTQSSIQMGCYAAAPSSLFGSGCSGSSTCGQCVQVTYGGKSIYVQIVDMCAACSNPGHLLDLGPRAFCMLADMGAGKIQATVNAVPCGNAQFDSNCQLMGQGGSSGGSANSTLSGGSANSTNSSSTANSTSSVAPPASKSCTCSRCPCSTSSSV